MSQNTYYTVLSFSEFLLAFLIKCKCYFVSEDLKNCKKLKKLSNNISFNK